MVLGLDWQNMLITRTSGGWGWGEGGVLGGYGQLAHPIKNGRYNLLHKGSGKQANKDNGPHLVVGWGLLKI